MRKSSNKAERTYTTTFVIAEQPIDLSVFCELIAHKMLTDKNLITKETKNNDNRKVC